MEMEIGRQRWRQMLETEKVDMETEMMSTRAAFSSYDPRFLCGCVQKPHLYYCDFVKYYFVFFFLLPKA